MSFVIRNMSSPSYQTIEVKPAPLRGRAVGFSVKEVFGVSAVTPAMALALFGLPEDGAPRDLEKRLAACIEAEIAERRLLGCAIVTTEVPEDAVPAADARLAIAVLAKSSDRLFVARKAPILTAEALSRRLATFDRRFQ